MNLLLDEVIVASGMKQQHSIWLIRVLIEQLVVGLQKWSAVAEDTCCWGCDSNFLIKVYNICRVKLGIFKKYQPCCDSNSFFYFCRFYKFYWLIRILLDQSSVLYSWDFAFCYINLNILSNIDKTFKTPLQLFFPPHIYQLLLFIYYSIRNTTRRT